MLNIHWKDWSWSSNILATWWKEPTHWKRPWCWERLKVKGGWGGREWGDWMASLTQQTWVWANSERKWRTEEPSVLQSMGSQRVWHDWVTEQQLICITEPLSCAHGTNTTLQISYVCVSRSVVSSSLRPHGVQPTRLLRPWDFPGQNTGVGCHFLLQNQLSQVKNFKNQSNIAWRGKKEKKEALECIRCCCLPGAPPVPCL